LFLTGISLTLVPIVSFSPHSIEQLKAPDRHHGRGLEAEIRTHQKGRESM
jgi:hypothetical protein